MYLLKTGSISDISSVRAGSFVGGRYQLDHSQPFFLSSQSYLPWWWFMTIVYHIKSKYLHAHSGEYSSTKITYMLTSLVSSAGSQRNRLLYLWMQLCKDVLLKQFLDKLKEVYSKGRIFVMWLKVRYLSVLFW